MFMCRPRVYPERSQRKDGDPVDNHILKGIFNLDSLLRGNDFCFKEISLSIIKS